MITEEIFNTFVHQTATGVFCVVDPINQDGLIGYGYKSEDEAKKAFTDFIEKEGIIFE